MSTQDITLYSIVDQMEELQKMRDEAMDLDDPDLREALNNSWEEIEGTFEEKVKNILAVYRNHKALADAAKAEKDRLDQIKKSAEGQMDWLKGYLLYQLKRTGKTSVKTVMGTVSIRKGSPLVNIVDPTQLPEGTYNIPTDIIPDKKAIKDMIENGEEVPGAEIITGPDSIQIR